ncbi:MAG: fibronectin type III domain-containing protein [Paludibacter sp.]|nr:fibronectin type III domain-containing protein [Paludibacter sp.]
MKKTVLSIFAAAALMAQAGNFIPGNIVVSRVGVGGTTALSGVATPVSILEFLPTTAAQTTSVQSFDLTSSAGTDKLTVYGTTNTSGQVMLSADGRFLSIVGYDQVSTTATATCTAGGKVVARINNAGTVDYSTKFPTLVNVLGSASYDGSQFWLNGGTAASGTGANYMGYQGFGLTTAPFQITSSGPSRTAGIFNNQLFALRGFDNIYAYTQASAPTGLPTSTSTTVASGTMTTAVSLSPNLSADGFVFFDLDPSIGWNGTGLDVVYVSNVNSGLEKYYWNGTDWKAANSQYHFKISITNGGSGYTVAPAVTIGRGEWTPNTAYAVNDYVVTTSGSRKSFLVSTAGTSGTTIPTATNANLEGVGYTLVGNSAITATSVLTGGVVTDVVITQGTFTAVPPITIANPVSGTTATATGSFSNNHYNNMTDFPQLAQLTGALNSDGNPVIYALKGNGTATNNTLIAITDNSGRTNSMTSLLTPGVVLATAGTNYAFRGVAFAPQIVPSAPTAIAVAPGNTQLSVSFTTPENNGGSAITNYKYSTDGGATFTTCSPVQTTSPILITGLTNETLYNVQIKAINTNGDGTSSQIKSGTPSNTTGFDNSTLSNLKVIKVDGGLSIRSAKNESYKIMNTVGQLIARGVCTSDNEFVSLKNKGVVLVQVNKQVTKVLLTN